MVEDTMDSDADLRTRLVAALAPVGGTVTRTTLDMAGGLSLSPANQLRQSKRKHDAPRNPFSTRGCVLSTASLIASGRDEDNDLSTANLRPKRARFSPNIASGPNMDLSTQHTVTQHLTNYHPPPGYPASRHTAFQQTETEVQLPALISQRIPSAPQQRLPLAPQPTPSSPVQDVHEQSREIHRILACPADAYFDILSLANGTARFSLVEISWLDLFFLVHPRRCPLPDAIKALSRVNDAYSWIQKNTGMVHPHVPASPMPPLAQDALSIPKASVAPSSPRERAVKEEPQAWDDSSIQTQPAPQQPEPHRRTSPPTPRRKTIEEPQRPRDKTGSQTQPAPQQPESCPTRKTASPFPSAPALKKEPQPMNNSGTQTQSAPQHHMSWDIIGEHGPPPRWVYPPRPSSHIYVTNGEPTIRPAVGWQFRKHGAETRVWYHRRWRPLIRNRPDFQGVYVNKRGWIMPIMSGVASENHRRKIQNLAKLEFNSHP